MENIQIKAGSWVKLQQITDTKNGDKFHRVPKKAHGKWTKVMKETVHGNYYVYNPNGGSALSIRSCDVSEVSTKNPINK